MTGEAFSAQAVGGQSYIERSPVPALRELASSVWTQHVGREAAPYEHRHLPNGAVEVVCRVGSAPQVFGPLTEPLIEVLEPGTTVVGVRFMPGAFPTVAGQPASEVVGLALDAEELWGRSAAALGEAVGTAASPQEALAAVQLHVHERAGAGEPPDPIVSEAARRLMPWRRTAVTSLSASLAISETQLRRRCRTAIGLAPKALHRMLRFQGFLALVQQAIALGRAPTDDPLALLALRTGYADQSPPNARVRPAHRRLATGVPRRDATDLHVRTIIRRRLRPCCAQTETRPSRGWHDPKKEAEWSSISALSAA